MSPKWDSAAGRCYCCCLLTHVQSEGRRSKLEDHLLVALRFPFQAVIG